MPLHIAPGETIVDSFDGQTIVVSAQRDGEHLSLFSAKTDGIVTGKSVQRLEQIAEPANLRSAMNANYFVMSDGQGLGIRCGRDEWSVPRQNAWYYYALLRNGDTEIGSDVNFWHTATDAVFACSPALILLRNGKTVNYESPSAKGSKSRPTRQSMLIRTRDRFAFAVSQGNLTPEQCRQWALTIDGIQDLCLMDSGGSSALYDEGELIVSTTRPISNALGFYSEIKSMTLRGIDISNWQKGIDLRKLDFDFVICKATEGITFVDPYCNLFMNTAEQMGKLRGFYHFAHPSNDALEEARFFYKNTSNYFGHAIPVLDWESENKNDVQWALRWLNEVQRLSGVKPMIYMSESVVNAYDWYPVVQGDYGLWVAKYRDNIPDYNYDMSSAGNAPRVKWWNGYAMWQWTSTGRLDGYSGSLDCDIFYGDRNAWNAYAMSRPSETPPETETDALRRRIEELEETVADLEKRIEKALNALKGETS